MTFRTFFWHTAQRDEGFALIEVVITALLVSLIVVATLTGYDAIGRTTADERYHDQAVLLAAQSQEALRSDPASALDTLNTEPHTYTVTLAGETYTIEQQAEFVNGVSETTACAAGSSQSPGRYVKIISSVSWPQLLAAKRLPLLQSSIITPPDGSGLEVDARTLAEPTAPVTGASVVAGEASTTTSAEGCAIFAAIPATTINLEVSKPNFVTPAGEYQVVAKEVSIAPNVTTHYAVTLDEGGAIEAQFVYNKATEFEKMPVTGDTFVAANPLIGVAPEFELGSTKVTTFSSGTYEALPATASGGYEPKATTPISAEHYATGNLFPFTAGYSVYAGDCPENTPPSAVVKAETAGEGSVIVNGGETVKVKVPMSFVKLTVYSGTEKTPVKEELAGESKNKEEPYAIKIKNKGFTKECKLTPNNAAKEASVTHLQHLLTSKENASQAGHLQAPFQPFGKFELCLWSRELKKTYTVSYENLTTAGSSKTLYLGATGSKFGTVTEGMTVKTEQSSNTC